MFDKISKAAGNAWNGGGSKIADAMTLGVAGTFFGPNADKADISGEQAQREAAIRALEGMAPKDYERYKYQGDFTPEMLAELEQQGQTELSQISTDPATRAAQMQALAQLQSRATDGYNVEDRAAIQQAMNETAQQEASQRGALQASMQARGAGGSGAELAMQLANQQGAASRNNVQGLQIAADGRRRALEAAMQSGQLGGSIRGQDYSEQAARAQAQDAINRFNTTNSVNRSVTNNATTNAAGAGNWAARQGIADRNVSTGNDFQQKKFDNQGVTTNIRYGAATNDANAKLTQAAQDQAQKDAQKDRYIKVAGMAADVGAKAAKAGG